MTGEVPLGVSRVPRLVHLVVVGGRQVVEPQLRGGGVVVDHLRGHAIDAVGDRRRRLHVPPLAPRVDRVAVEHLGDLPDVPRDPCAWLGAPGDEHRAAGVGDELRGDVRASAVFHLLHYVTGVGMGQPTRLISAGGVMP